MPGPPPNPNARRRNDKDAWRTLPARCDKPAPKWPLPGRKVAGLVELWRHLWTLPVAEIWHEQNAVQLVARYALLMLQTREPEQPIALHNAITAIEDRLGISPMPRLKARVLIEEASAAPAVATGGNVTNIDDFRDLGIA